MMAARIVSEIDGEMIVVLGLSGELIDRQIITRALALLVPDGVGAVNNKNDKILHFCEILCVFGCFI